MDSGYHAPSGPLNQVVDLRFSANGHAIPWKRDPLDLFKFHITVPTGVERIESSLDFVLPTKPAADLGAASPWLFILEWNDVLVYPSGKSGKEIRIAAEVRLLRG
jgi:Peptidase M61 N-terminal domain